MALQDSGSIPPTVSMSLLDINEELGESPTQMIDFLGAATSFSGILDDGQVEILEFYNKTFSVGTGPYGARALHEFTFVEDAQDGDVAGFSNGELVSAAERSTTDLTSPYDTLADESDFVGFEVDDGQLTNGDKIYENSTGVTLTNLRPGGDFPAGTMFMLDNDADKIFQIDSSAVVSNVTDRTPAKPPTPTGTAPSSTQIDLSITNANTIVTRTYQISRSLTSGGTFSGVGTVSPSAKGNIGNTSVTTTYSDTGLSAGTTYYYKVRGHNTFGNTLSDESAGITTAAAGTSWGTISDFDMHLGSSPPSSQTLESGEKTLTLTNGSGNTTITVNQPNNSNPPPTLEIKVGDSSGNYNLISSYTTTPAAIPSRTTYYMKFKLTQAGTKENSAEDCQIRFTNNSVNRDFNINVQIGGLFP